ncbi:hypothetical protein HPB50_010723 [Hyalomma asiaticum]|uniref:Uncharacterized protein n=1 Tax=Hyalomma asiaticum TaxID=266040 RepID=A0ACB7S7X5_HYAAI|nr:hypothetical protein HPB50_010723 [Hyalomma asiaticum]
MLACFAFGLREAFSSCSTDRMSSWSPPLHSTLLRSKRSTLCGSVVVGNARGSSSSTSSSASFTATSTILAQVLIMDEPTVGLDPETRRAVWTVVKELRGKASILLSTHDMEEADILGDRIIVMYSGSVICWGSPSFLKNACALYETDAYKSCGRRPTLRHMLWKCVSITETAAVRNAPVSQEATSSLLPAVAPAAGAAGDLLQRCRRRREAALRSSELGEQLSAVRPAKDAARVERLRAAT